MMESVIDRILSKINNSEIIESGMDERFTSACIAGDTIRQGNLYIMIVDNVPQDYVEVIDLKEIDCQLEIGNIQGARHCLDSIDGVRLFRPVDWNEESLDGPAIVLSKDRVILHPVHGDVGLCAGHTILIFYQREWSKEQAKERKTID